MKKWALIALTAALLLTALTIFGFSSQESSKSGKLSRYLAGHILQLVYPDYASLPSRERSALLSRADHILRKAAHFSEYALLGGLLLAWLQTLRPVRPVSGNAWIAFALGALYAVSDERHQGFVAGRSPELRDIVIDSCGTLAGIAACALLLWLLERRRRRKRAAAVNTMEADRKGKDL